MSAGPRKRRSLRKGGEGEVTDGVDVAPVGLDLGVLEGVAVHLAGGGEQKPSAHPLGEPQHVEGPHYIRLVNSSRIKENFAPKTKNNKIKRKIAGN